MTTNYTIIVTVTADDQRKAFRFVEEALSVALEAHEDVAPDAIHVSTPDGTLSVELFNWHGGTG